MKKKFRKPVCIFLAAFFVVSTMFSAFAETGAFEAAPEEAAVAIEAGCAEQMEYSGNDPDQSVCNEFDGDSVLLGDNTEKKQLESPTVSWTDDLRAYVVLPEYYQDWLRINYWVVAADEWGLYSHEHYFELDWPFHSVDYGLDEYNTVGGVFIDESLYGYDKELESAVMFFTVQLLADGENYLDSAIVCSEDIYYVAPEERLTPPTATGWEKDSEGNVCLKIARAPGESGSSSKVEWYYAKTEKDKPVSTGWTSFTAPYDKNGVVMVRLVDNAIAQNGSGFYYAKVRTLSDDLRKIRTSKQSDFSEGYLLAEDIEKTIEKLDKIDPSGKSQSQIAEEVQQIPTVDLRVAMLAEGEALAQIERLEEATGIETTVEVKEEIKGIETENITVKGAALNKLIDDQKNITLTIGKPAQTRLLPAVSIQFSMDLKNLEDTEDLKVPVLIDMPIPSTMRRSHLIIHHYCLDGTEEKIYPATYKDADGKWHAKFVLTRFSDFVLTEEEPESEPGIISTSVQSSSGSRSTDSRKITYSNYWFVDTDKAWKVRKKTNEIVKKTWLCDDAVSANGQNAWYLLGPDGSLITAGLVQDASGNYFSLETSHNGYFGMRYQNGTYDGIPMEFSNKHDGTFGAITNQSAIDALKAKYGVTKVDFSNDAIAYTSAF